MEVLKELEPPFELLVLTPCQTVEISPVAVELGKAMVEAVWIPERPMVERVILRLWVPEEEKLYWIRKLGWIERGGGQTPQEEVVRPPPYWDIIQRRLIPLIRAVTDVPGWEAYTFRIHRAGVPPKVYHAFTTIPREEAEYLRVAPG